MTEWWEQFFDDEYIRIWEGNESAGHADDQAAGLWSILSLHEGSRVLDAPCGYGRISKALAGRGALVLGVDLSDAMLAEAERRRGDLPTARLRYKRHDLRTPIEETGFDAAINLFSSLGYGGEAEDLAILRTLKGVVRPGGLVFIECNHRDRLVTNLAHARSFASRLPDGTLMVEEPRFDPVTGRVETTFYWSGPIGHGRKRASIRIYTVTELIGLLHRVGLHLRSVHDGCTPEPFAGKDSPIGGRLGVLAVREES